jgi:hypothetical protein
MSRCVFCGLFIDRRPPTGMISDRVRRGDRAFCLAGLCSVCEVCGEKRAILQNSGDHVVAVDKDVCGDGHRFADRPFDRKSSPVDFRADTLYDDPSRKPGWIQMAAHDVRQSGTVVRIKHSVFDSQ